MRSLGATPPQNLWKIVFITYSKLVRLFQLPGFDDATVIEFDFLLKD